MALTTHPFHPTTGTLLPGFRDAYLRGDLSRTNSELVDAYLRDNALAGDDTLRRFQKLRATGHQVRPVGWVGQQYQLLRSAPARFRQRASALLLVGVCVSGLVFAGTGKMPMFGTPGAGVAMLGTLGGEAVASGTWAAATMTLHGRILDENGAPLVGATVIDKTSGRGVSTNADGDYALQVPANGAARLQYGFGGYQDEELLTQRQRVQNVTLLPDATKKGLQHKKHWWSLR